MGYVIAFLAGVPAMAGFNAKIEDLSGKNPFFTGGAADWLALIPFVILIGVLYLTGREAILAHRQPST